MLPRHRQGRILTQRRTWERPVDGGHLSFPAQGLGNPPAELGKFGFGDSNAVSQLRRASCAASDSTRTGYLGSEYPSGELHASVRLRARRYRRGVGDCRRLPPFYSPARARVPDGDRGARAMTCTSVPVAPSAARSTSNSPDSRRPVLARRGPFPSNDFWTIESVLAILRILMIRSRGSTGRASIWS